MQKSQVASLDVGQAVVAKLDFSQDEIDRVKSKLLELTEAMVTVRTGRDENGKIIYGEVPNVGIQLAATVKVLEFAVGKPKQMIAVEGSSSTGQGQAGIRDLARLMHDNPEITGAILAAVRDGARITQAIDVTGTSEKTPVQPPESKA